MALFSRGKLFMQISNEDTRKGRILPQSLDSLRSSSLPWQYPDTEKIQQLDDQNQGTLAWAGLEAKPVLVHFVLGRTSHFLPALSQN